MKKLMITAAAALCATVVANADGITSANIVGYQNLDLTVGEQEIASVQFMTVDSTEGVDLLDLKPNANFGYEGGSYIMWWDSSKGFVKAYWTDPDYESADNAVWCDKEDAPLARGFKTFKCGEGFFVYPLDASKGVSITTSGALVSSDSTAERLELNLTEGEQEFVANPMPVAFSLNTLKPNANFGYEGGSYIMWWNSESGYVKAYWTDPDYESADNAVWCDKGDAPLASDFKTFKAGEGFWVYPLDASEGVALTFVNPFYTK